MSSLLSAAIVAVGKITVVRLFLMLNINETSTAAGHEGA